MDAIRYIGLNDLGAEEKTTVNKLTDEYFQRLKRDMHNELQLVVHVKVLHQKESKRKEYHMEARAEAPTQIFESSNEDWNIEVCTHDLFRKLEKEIKHKFHSEGSDNTKNRAPGKTKK